MIRKLVSGTVPASGVAGAIAATQGTASAATFVPAGVYPSSDACAAAGNAGLPQHRWVGWTCKTSTTTASTC
ncbi:hypothetical protein [Amycolatopsis panacis]|uniref:hypothetical protein n=1 Tax=Amycolatopsis panacis TaxID=2340917 RepID=UPI001F3467FE|nr:hypothetical protein [Amycolatopsis panacis]